MPSHIVPPFMDPSPANSGMSKYIGRFVRQKRGGVGVGKIAEIDGRKVVVEYFESIGKRTRETADPSSLTIIRLQPQTRCYLWSEEERRWEVGRIGSYDQDDGTYEVILPGQRVGYVPEARIYVRCDKPVEDPTDTLILKANETPFFHYRRSAFVEALIEQRHAARGLTGLVSSSIDLFAHQAEVVRRVLEDPVQRYLLADEVGLGKTVEAGAILRQYLLDEPEGMAVILVPKFLLEQWRQELEGKFHASNFEERITLRPVEEVGELQTDYWLGLLIIDEAHHVAGGAYSRDPGLKRLYENCRRLAHRSGRLLLLSATPVLNNEQDFLAMLHLLDPLTYSLDDLHAFWERVRARQDIGRILLSFKEDAHPFVLRTSLKNLRQVFPKDERLQGLLNELEETLQNADAGSAEKVAAVRSIRTHVSDTYRLHRRMLRNRRESVQLAGRMDSTRTALDLKVEYDLDERAAEVHDRIDEWRVRAADGLGAEADEARRADLENDLQDIFLTLLRASGSWAGLLQKVVEARLTGEADPILDSEFGPSPIERLTNTAKFEGEDELLTALLSILRTAPDGGDRVDVLQAALQRLRGAGSKVVVFTSFTSTGQELTRRLSRAFGSKSIASHVRGADRKNVEADVERFRNDPSCSLLICDPSGEEGRNLQLADWVVHFDLPWSPNRLEQRIGRLDRIGRSRTVRTRVFLGPETDDTLHDAWYDLFKNGFRVFERSIASLQFYVDEKMPQLQTAFFRGGAAGLARSVEVVKEEIEAELVKINEQNALDEIDALEKSVTGYFDLLTAHDRQYERIKHATEGYAVDALKFGWTKNPSDPDVISYSYIKNRTLVSPSEVLDFFAYSLKEPGTYRRGAALRRAEVNLYRIGQDFIEALAEYVRWDDRGQAFAMWRHDPSWDASEGAEWHGFRFKYVVEARLDEAQAVLTRYGVEGAGSRALWRRADALFPPFIRTVYIDHNMQEVTDPNLIQILSQPYSKRPNPGRDYNLDYKRSAVIDSIEGSDRWANLCRSARTTSEESLRGSESFRRECETRTRSAERQLAIRVEQLRMRSDRAAEGEGAPDPTLAQDLELEEALGRAMVKGITDPSVRLDSIGYIIISGRAPAYPDEGED